MYRNLSYAFMDGLVEAVILTEDEQDNEKHIDVVGTLATTVIKLMQ